MKKLFKTIVILSLIQLNLIAQTEEVYFSLNKVEELKSEINTQRNLTYELPFLRNSTLKLNLRPHNLISGDLQRKFPQHKNYRVYSPEDSSISGFLLCSPTGIFYTINTKEGFISFRPSKKENIYIIDKGLHAENHHICGLVEDTRSMTENPRNSVSVFSNGEFLRIYRMAMIVTGEFYEANGNEDDEVLSWVQYSLDGVNTIFQRDLAVNFEVGNRLLFYNDSENDAFTPDGAGGNSRLEQASEIISENFGEDEYDIGHILHNTSSSSDWSGGGIAGLNALCSNDDFGNGIRKAKGWSGSFNNQNNGWIQLFAHEVGHQCGASHTFNATGNSCTNNISEVNSYEIGSGSTIMSYRGLCGPGQNQSFSSTTDNYFHVNSLEAMVNLMNDRATCFESFETNNILPELEINPCNVDAYKIPINTPFRLRADGFEPNAGQTLSFNWEQYDEDGDGTPTQGMVGLDAANEVNTPLFRNYAPTENPERTFPRIDKILSGTIDDFEVLPMVERDITMRMTLRDNFEGGGAITVDEITLNVENGPLEFVLPASTSTNAFDAGTTMNIAWDTNGSDDLCEKVNILMSLDGGANFGITIAEDVDYKDGNYEYDIPAGLLSNQNSRLKIECTDHSCFSFFIISEPFEIFSECIGNTHSLCNTDDVLATEGTDDLNLQLENILGTEIRSLDIEITNSNASSVFVRRALDGTCQIPRFQGGGQVNLPHSFRTFVVEEDGSYSFIRSGGGFFSIYEEALMDPDDPCAGWLESNALESSNSPGTVTTGSTSTILVDLKKCTPYIIAATSFQTPILMNIDVGNNPIINPEPLKEGTSYTFIAVDLTTQEVVYIDDNADLRNIPNGFYDVYGIQYKDDEDPQSWLGLSLAQMLARGDCFVLSSNKKEVIVLEDLNNPCAGNGFSVNTSSTAAGCFEDNGTATVEIINGEDPFAIFWSNDLASNTISNLAPGNYMVTVTDAEGCTATSSINVERAENPDIEFILSGTTLTADVQNGSGNYSYEWYYNVDLLDETSNTIELETEGDYVLVLRDLITGCVVEDVYFYEDLCATLSADLEIDQINCNGETNGAATIIGSGGTEPYQYLWTLSDGSTSLEESITDLGPGDYSILLTDAEMCTFRNDFQIAEPDPLLTELSPINESELGANDASISSVATGGTMPYSYSWIGPNGFESDETDLTNISPGEYCLIVIDANNCMTEACIDIAPGDCADGVVMITTSDISCFGANDGSAVLSNFDEDRSYDIVWTIDDITSAEVSALLPGDYEAMVTDDLGCTQSFIFNIAEPDALSLMVNSMDESSLNLEDGAAMAVVNGGTLPYTYNWFTIDGNLSTEQEITDLSPGNYCVLVTDANDCTIEECVDILAGEDPCLNFSFNLDINNVSCFGEASGSASVTVNGAADPVTIEWSNGIVDESISNLMAGQYSVTITDANGCSNSEPFDILTTDELLINLMATNESSLNAADGAIESEVSGGTLPYTYLWTNGDNTENLTNLPAGNYCLTLTDNNNCSATSCIDVLPGDDPCIDFSISLSANDVACFGDMTGMATVEIEGGLEPYNIEWNTGAQDPNISNLEAGTYQVTVIDDNNCMQIQEIEISENPTLNLDIDSNNESAPDLADGTAMAMVSGGAEPYSFIWSNGNENQMINNLPPGEYCVTVTDENNCMIEACVEILPGNDPCVDFNISLSSNNILCFGEATGVASVEVTGGLEPYVVNWNNGSNALSLTNLTAGTYKVEVSDANDCTSSEEIIITEPEALALLITSTNETALNEADGTINSEISGGVSPYTYLWSNNDLSANLENLASGEYCLTVSDANGCTVENCIEVLPGDDPCLDFSISLSANDVTCFGEMTGSAALQINGGLMPYTILWNTGLSSNSIDDLSAGTYTVTVTDANECELMEEIIIQEPESLSLNLNASNESAPGLNDGTTSAIVNGGTAPYLYLWSNGLSTSALTNLEAGEYCLTITDANGCTAEACADVLPGNDPCVDFTAVLSTNDVLCFGEATGQAMLEASGGMEPYTVIWSTGSNNLMQLDLLAGDYSVTITDANDCQENFTFNITEAEELNLNLVSTNETSLGANDGSADATISGGTAPYTFLWSNASSQEDLTGLSAGEYCLTVTDANNCQIETCLTIEGGDDPCLGISFDLSFTQSNNLCFGNNDGSAMVITNSGSGPFTYEWNTGAASQMLGNLAQGLYTVTVTDNNNCSDVGTVEISEPTALAYTLTDQINESADGAMDGSISVEVNGGTPPYFYSWSNGSNEPSLENLMGGDYSLTVNDANDCELSQEFTISTNTTTSGGMATVQFIHAAFDETVSLSNAEGTFLPYLAYTMATPPMEVSAGNYTINLDPLNFWAISGAQQVEANFEEGKSYIAVIYGTFDESDDKPLGLSIRETSFGMQDEKEVNFDFFNGAHDSPDFDITNNGDLILEDAKYGRFAKQSDIANVSKGFQLSLNDANTGSLINNFWADFGWWKSRGATFFTIGTFSEKGNLQLWVALSEGGAYQLNGYYFVRGKKFNQNQDLGYTFEIKPNPSKFIPSIDLLLYEKDDIQVEIYYMNGKLIQSKDFGELNIGQHYLIMPSNQLEAGNYYVRLIGRNSTSIKQLQIVH